MKEFAKKKKQFIEKDQERSFFAFSNANGSRARASLKKKRIFSILRSCLFFLAPMPGLVELIPPELLRSEVGHSLFHGNSIFSFFGSPILWH